MKLRTLLVLANVVCLLALALQLAMILGGERRTYMMASWKDRPASVEATTQLAQTVVTGKVTRIRKADPIVTQLSVEPGGVDRIPVEVITIQRLEDDVKGKDKKNSSFELFHTGHSDAVAPPDRKPPGGQPPPKPAEGAVEKDRAEQSRDHHMGVLFSAIMEDPAYKVGEEYVLFVRQGPKLKVQGQDVQTLGIVSPEGRYRVKTDKTLEPMSDREFAKQLRGKPVKELKDRAARAAGPK